MSFHRSVDFAIEIYIYSNVDSGVQAQAGLLARQDPVQSTKGDSLEEIAPTFESALGSVAGTCLRVQNDLVRWACIPYVCMGSDLQVLGGSELYRWHASPVLSLFYERRVIVQQAASLSWSMRTWGG